MKPAVSHWWMQRLTAVGLIPLSLWFIFGALPHLGGEYTQACSFLGTFFGVIPALLLNTCLFYHGALGIQVVIEDYISLENQREFILSLLKGISWGGILIGNGALLKIFFQ